MLQKYIGFLTAIPDFSYFSKSLIFMVADYTQAGERKRIRGIPAV